MPGGADSFGRSQPGTKEFKKLTDTPASYAGNAGKYAKVNAGEDALEFDTPAGSGDMSKSTYDPNNDGVIAVGEGGTGATNTADARNALDAAKKWSLSEISADPANALPFVTYLCDASGGAFTVTLPNVDATNDGMLYRVILQLDGNPITVTTAGAVQQIGDLTSQVINELNAGITLQANNTSGRYEIVQDSRAHSPLAQLTFYGLTEASDIGGYTKLATTTSDDDYSQTPTDLELDAITGSDQLLGSWASAAGAIIGLVTETTVNGAFKLRKTAGAAGASFYLKVFHRTAGGSETELGQSGATEELNDATYVQHELSGVINAQNFISTDRLVVKFYGTKVGAETDPTFEVELEGTTPARVTIPLASGSINVDSLSGILSVAKGGTGKTDAREAFDNLKRDATYTSEGVLRKANDAMVNTATADDAGITPSALRQSKYGVRYLPLALFESDEAVSTGDGTVGIMVPPGHGGWEIVEVVGACHDAGSGGGTTDVMLRRRRAGADQDLLTRHLQLVDSQYYTNNGVVDTDNDDIQDGDIWYFDVDSIMGTPPNGLTMMVGIRRPA